MSETKSTDALIAVLKCGEYDGVDIMQAWCRLRQLEAENKALKEEQLKGKSLLRGAGELPKGCYCDSGKCMAPKPQWCKDTDKRDALTKEEL